MYHCPEILANCTGHGICRPVESSNVAGDWGCLCQLGFCGHACDRICPQCPNNCTGQGLCDRNTCVCNPGFEGSDCSVVASIDGCPANCSGHGTCELSDGLFGCHCFAGFTNSECSSLTGVCPRNCSGKGECVDGVCKCMRGYNGTGCERAVATCASSNHCSLNGICQDGICACFPGFRGFDCSVACLSGLPGNYGCNADRSHGVCTNGTCVCRDGEYEGEWCEAPAHEMTIGSVTSASNPIGLIVVSILGAFAVFALAGFGYNMYKGKRGLNAVPGIHNVKGFMKGDDYEQAPDNRFSTNF